MSFDPQPGFSAPPASANGDDRRVGPGAPGAVRRHEDTRPHAALDHSPIAYVSVQLWDELARLAIAPAATDATVLALLRVIAAGAVDAALAPGNEGAPRDDLYVCHPAYIGSERHTVWFQRNGPRGPITALLPPER